MNNDGLIVNTFDSIVKATEKAVLPEIRCIDNTIKKLNYQHGHYTEIHQTLRELTNTPNIFNEVYPLIALLEDIRYRTLNNGAKEAQFTIVICYTSTAERKSKDRYKAVIEPILMPIYKELINQTKISGLFLNYEIPHDMITRPYLGNPSIQNGGTKKNNANLFSDILDAIELQNIRVNIFNNC